MILAHYPRGGGGDGEGAISLAWLQTYDPLCPRSSADAAGIAAGGVDECSGTGNFGMDEHRKNAYRLLLYHAMLEIRCVASVTHKPLCFLNPFVFRRKLRDAARAGGLANWLHNLAQLSAYDFKDFDEGWFWQDYDRLLARYPGGWMDYRKAFERALMELDASAGK